MIMMLIVSKGVFSSQSFALRSSSTLIPFPSSSRREISLKSSKEFIQSYLGRPSPKIPPKVRQTTELLSPLKWNPFGWFSSAVSASTRSLKTTNTRSTIKKEQYKLITDVDDTIVSSGGVKLFGIKLGGIDNRFKRGQFYPGVIQFALELSRVGHSAPPSLKGGVKKGEQVKDPSQLPSKVAVLTARAREFKFALALRPSSKLNKRYRLFGESSGFPEWGIGDVYYGSVMEWIFHHRKGLRKFKNFEIMLKNDDANRDRNPTSASQSPKRYILLGDTGEKDEEAGERMAMQYPDRVRAIFLHTVYNINDQIRLSSPPPSQRADRKVNGVPVHYFRTYVGAAIKAFENQMIGRDAVQRITHKAIEEMKELDQFAQLDYQRKVKFFSQFPLPAQVKQSKTQQLKLQVEEIRKLRWEELKRDIDSCSFLKPLLSSDVISSSSATVSSKAIAQTKRNTV